MTLLEYVENPMGKGSMILPNTKMKQGFIETFQAINKTMKITWYTVMNTYIAKVSLPSTSASNKGAGLDYDIVFQFKNASGLNKVAILNSEWSIYSNSPSFVYTYAHVFYKKKMICKWLENKLGRTIKTISPAIRNQYNVIGYERSLYLAALMVIQSMSNPIPINGSFKSPIATNYTHLSTIVKSIDDVLIITKNKEKKIDKLTTQKIQHRTTTSSSKSNIDSSYTTKVSKTKKTPKTAKTKKI